MKYRPPARVIAKNKEHGLVLLGGLGVLGVGIMWKPDTDEYKEREGYNEAPEQEVDAEGLAWVAMMWGDRKNVPVNN